MQGKKYFYIICCVFIKLNFYFVAFGFTDWLTAQTKYDKDRYAVIYIYNKPSIKIQFLFILLMY